MSKNELFQILFACVGVIVVRGEAVHTIQNNIEPADLDSVIDQLTQNGRKAGVITNEADDKLSISCSSYVGDKWERNILPGRSMAFSFRPILRRKIYITIECTLEYKGFWNQWEVYQEFRTYINVNDKVYHYTVHNDGIYINGKKISSLASGKNRYVFWEHYRNKGNLYGRSLTGYVDSGICNNIPDWMSDMISAITLCDHDCVIIYKFSYCAADSESFRAHGRCNNVTLQYFNDNVRSVKGC